jgi:dUTP pyrophosphatase
MDLYAAVTDDVVLFPGERVLVSAGIIIALPHGFEAQVRPRSGLAYKYGISVVNAPGTIDADYRGEVSVLLINHGKEDFIIRRGERIAQLVIHRVEQIEWIEVIDIDPSETERGGGGYGSTGG